MREKRGLLLTVVHTNSNFLEDRGGEHRKDDQRFQQRMVAAANVQLLFIPIGLLHICRQKQL